MKNLILGITLLLASFAFNANAATGAMAEVKIKEGVSFEKALVNLFAKEAKKPNSKLNVYLSALKSNPENAGYTIDDTITELDIVRLESGGGAVSFEVNYLIIIRAGYKSGTFQVGYLKARAFGSMDESSLISIQITEPAKVIIE